MELPMLFIKVIHKNGADVLFFPSIRFLKANSCSESFHGYSFHKNFEHLEKKAHSTLLGKLGLDPDA